MYYIDREILDTKKDEENGLVTLVVKSPPKKNELTGEEIPSIISQVVVSDKLYEHVITEEPVDHNTHVQNRLKPIVEGVLVLMRAYSMILDDWSQVQQMVSKSLAISSDLAVQKHWGKPKYEVTVLDLDNVLKQDAEKTTETKEVK